MVKFSRDQVKMTTISPLSVINSGHSLALERLM